MSDLMDVPAEPSEAAIEAAEAAYLKADLTSDRMWIRLALEAAYAVDFPALEAEGQPETEGAVCCCGAPVVVLERSHVYGCQFDGEVVGKEHGPNDHFDGETCDCHCTCTPEASKVRYSPPAPSAAREALEALDRINTDHWMLTDAGTREGECPVCEDIALVRRYLSPETEEKDKP
jgi:hypothetical protein